jgi:surface antigen
MKKTACVKLFALAIVAISMGGQAEAGSASRERRGSDHHKAAHEGHAVTHEGAMSARLGRLPVHEVTSRGHGSFRQQEGRGHSRQASWQGYGRFHHTALVGRSGRHHGYSGGGGIQCVTFARSDSGIELSGNARDWWANAAGVYQRGNRPEPGSVLNFRANGAMRMGHVAVVNQVIDGRTLIIDHANWGGPGAVRGGVSRNISVVDVSPANDWSAVRVALGHSGDYGSIYPTYGFIYNRPDAGTILASNNTGTAVPALNPAPRDLRPRESYDEVAEAPDGAMPAFSHHPVHRRHHGVAIVSHRVRHSGH